LPAVVFERTPGEAALPPPSNWRCREPERTALSTNVIRIPSAQPSDAGQSLVPTNPVVALIAVIDPAIDENWSFDLVHHNHEVVGEEPIVFARLIVDGRNSGSGG
jgi:hypothetical protein